MPVSQSGAASKHSCCSQCQFLPEQINTASGKWYAAINLENATIPCPIGRGHQKQLSRTLIICCPIGQHKTGHYSNEMQLEPGEQAGALGYTNMVYACQRVGDKSPENTEIRPVYKGLVVRCVYQAIPSKVKHT